MTQSSSDLCKKVKAETKTGLLHQVPNQEEGSMDTEVLALANVEKSKEIQVLVNIGKRKGILTQLIDR